MLFDQKGTGTSALRSRWIATYRSSAHELRAPFAAQTVGFFLGMRYAEHGELTVNARGSGASGAEDAEENAEPERKVSPSKRDARWLQ